MAERRRVWWTALTAALALVPAVPAFASAPDAGAKTEAAAKGETAKGAKDAKAPEKGVAQPPKETKKEEAKVEAKKDEKKDEKADEKAEAKKDEKKDEKKDAKKPVAGKKGAKAGDDEPAPPNTPPIKMAALREEMSHPPVRREETGGRTRAEREKLEQLATEINKAREGLRQDTAKLEALLAARDAAGQAGSAPGTAPAGAEAEGGKKPPTSLDNLAKAIRGMKPEQAAPIISRVDRKLAADVLLRMPGGDAGKVLGVCKPEVAAELAAEIASRTPRAEVKR